MHITPAETVPSMSIARVREIVQELGDATSSGLVAYFNREQLVDLLADIERRAPVAPSSVTQSTDPPAITSYSKHTASCDRCHKGGGANRCAPGQQLSSAACPALRDQDRL